MCGLGGPHRRVEERSCLLKNLATFPESVIEGGKFIIDFSLSHRDLALCNKVAKVACVLEG
jgi:hypothetical protein